MNAPASELTSVEAIGLADALGPDHGGRRLGVREDGRELLPAVAGHHVAQPLLAIDQPRPPAAAPRRPPGARSGR